MPSIGGMIVKKVLANGLTILVNPVTNIPKVSMELWYHVGSKDEKSGEKGMAHLIEHMIFKGTEALSESDINVITHKLSGYTNAYTSHDTTTYLYEFPSQHWKEGFALLSDCMRNARFDEQMLNSELKAVVQELKMYNDHHVSSLVDELLGVMFLDHPYHYPIIGFKQDLWNLKRETLVNFYKKHYVPNNATLVVVGDVDVDEVLKESEKKFGHISKNESYFRPEYYHSRGMESKSVTLYRDIQQPVALASFSLPGATHKKQYLYDIISWILGVGDSSRLYRRLVDELQLVTDLQVTTYEMEDASPFLIIFEPKSINDIEKIHAIIHEEIADIVNNGLSEKELERAQKNVKTSLLKLLECNEKRTSWIGQHYIFTKDENYLLNYLKRDNTYLEREVREALDSYFASSMMHAGKVVPLPESEKKHWINLQELSDAEDARILDGKERTIPVELPKQAASIKVQPPKLFEFHRPEKQILSNGIKLFAHNDNTLPKIDIIVDFKAGSEYDPQDLQGVYAFMCDMLLEGTKNYPGKMLAEELENYGMHVGAIPGKIVISMLSEDFEKGLEFLYEILVNATFDESAIEKVREQSLSSLRSFWDSPRHIAKQLIREAIYKDHPYAKNDSGTFESLQAITKETLQDMYAKLFTADGARIAVVGDLSRYDVKEVLENYIGAWKGRSLPDIQYPALSEWEPTTIHYPMNRDQVVLALTCPSIKRTDKNFDYYLLFEQVFCGGSMSSRLFQLRERSGLFYSIGGSLAAHADEQPGYFLVTTMVSLDKLEESKKRIKEEIDTVVDSITEQELEDAKRVVINSQVDNFANNKRIAQAFLAIDRFNFSDDYFERRIQTINAITLDQVKEAARNLLDSKKMTTIEVGRVKPCEN